MVGRPKAGVYARISRDRRGEGLGVNRQQDDCAALCERLGWSVEDVYIDNDVSAYSGKRRPEYERLCADLADRRITAVAAWHPDRLHRSPKELEAFIDLIEATKAKVATVQAGEYDLTTAAGRMTARVVGAVARGESEHKSDRLKRKHLELAKEGKWAGGGTRPFGYDIDRRTLKPDEAELIRAGARQLLAGATLRSVTAAWDASGIRPVKGGMWTGHVIRRMLTSPRIAGWRSHHGTFAAEADWQPIVDRDTVERLRALLLDPARRLNANPRSYLLAGLAFCEVCDHRLVARPRADRRRCYVCASGPNYGGCGKIRVVAEPLEDYVAGMALDALDVAAVPTEPDERSAYDITVADLETQLADLAVDWADRRISRPEWLAARDRVEARLAAVRAGMAADVHRDRLAGLRGRGAELLASWELMPFDAKRPIIVETVDWLKVGPAVKGRNFFDSGRVHVELRL